MAGRWAGMGFVTLGLGGFSWLVAAIALGQDALIPIGFGVIGLGFLIAALGGAARVAAGTAIACLGFLPFFASFFESFEFEPHFAAALIFLLGLAPMLAFATWTWRNPGAPVRSTQGLRLGVALAGMAPILWIPLDLEGGAEWQAGNFLMLVGAWLVALTFRAR